MMQYPCKGIVRIFMCISLLPPTLPMSIGINLSCAGCNEYLLEGPIHCSFGERLCSHCFNAFSRLFDVLIRG